MKILVRLAVIAGVLAIATGARCAEFGGTWNGTFDFQGHSVALTFYLSSQGGAVTGTVEGLPTTPAEIHDGKIDGDTVTFSVNTNYHDQNFKLLFKGTRSSADGSIHFTLGTEDGSWSSELVAQRGVASGDSASASAAATAVDSAGAPGAASAAASEPATATATASEPAAAASAVPVAASGSESATASTGDVTGTWKGSFDYQGTAVPVTFHFTAKDKALTGTVEGLMEGAPDKSTEIHDGTVDGGAISFSVNTQYQGETYRILYKGKMDGGTKIDFTFGTEDGSWSSQLTASRATESAQQ